MDGEWDKQERNERYRTLCAKVKALSQRIEEAQDDEVSETDEDYREMEDERRYTELELDWLEEELGLNEDKKRQALGPFVWRMANGGGVALAHR